MCRDLHLGPRARSTQEPLAVGSAPLRSCTRPDRGEVAWAAWLFPSPQRGQGSDADPRDAAGAPGPRGSPELPCPAPPSCLPPRGQALAPTFPSILLCQTDSDITKLDLSSCPIPVGQLLCQGGVGPPPRTPPASTVPHTQRPPLLLLTRAAVGGQAAVGPRQGLGRSRASRQARPFRCCGCSLEPLSARRGALCCSQTRDAARRFHTHLLPFSNLFPTFTSETRENCEWGAD